MAHTRTDNQIVALTANTASAAITLDAGPDVTIAAFGAHGNAGKRTPKLMYIEVEVAKAGSDPVYFTIARGDDATVFADPATPTVGASGEELVAAAAGSITRVECSTRAAKLKLISLTAATVVVRVARPYN